MSDNWQSQCSIPEFVGTVRTYKVSGMVGIVARLVFEKAILRIGRDTRRDILRRILPQQRAESVVKDWRVRLRTRVLTVVITLLE